MLASNLINVFKERFAALIDKGMVMAGVYGNAYMNNEEELEIAMAQGADKKDEVHPDFHHISVMVSFIFDGRALPRTFEGFKILKSYIGSMVPKEIEEIVFDPAGFETSWTPQQFRSYVSDYQEMIRIELGYASLTIDDILDAICFGDFLKYCEDYEKARLLRLFK